jgi:aminobenzoyl-glutamate utilization protein B
MTDPTSGPETARRDMLLAAALAALPVAAAQAQTAAPAVAAPPAGAAPPASARVAAEAVAAQAEPITRIAREVWALAELSLHEARSAAVHLRELEAAGFTVTSRATAGFPGAFIAEWSQGSGGPKIGFLPEYDALPGLGNAAEPRLAAAPGGSTNGHGCGHNLLGAGCTGAALALKPMLEAARTPATLRVYGCAAEEMQGVKVYMAREKLFDDLDAALAWHPAPAAAAGEVRTAATAAIQVTFRGRTAHAGNSPWQGRSALDALELFTHGVNLMREHVEPTARLQYIITQGGLAPNIVPELAQLRMTVRDADRPRVEATVKWLSELATGAAMGTQTRAEFDVYFGTWDLLPNGPLARLLHAQMGAVPLDWSAEEQAFARACQAALGVAERGLAGRVMPLIPPMTVGGATDCGDVSWSAPTALFAWPTMPLGVSLHTWPVTACGGMSIGLKGALAAARVLAATGFELATDAALRREVRADFDRRRGELRYTSPLPDDRRTPLNAPWTNSGADQVLGSLDDTG